MSINIIIIIITKVSMDKDVNKQRFTTFTKRDKIQGISNEMF